MNSRRRFLGQVGATTLLAATNGISGAQTFHEAPFATIPDEFRGKLADVRSPLLFRDGSRVQTSQDWQKRREEILADWHRIMGEWPPMVERPLVEVLDRTVREGVSQQRIRIQVAPDQNSEGLLLIPQGAGPFPAVFVPYYDAETSVGLSKNAHRDFAWQLALRGFVGLVIGSPGGDARKPILSRQAHCQPLSYLASIAAVAWNALSQMPVVDSKRIGIVGHSYGGKWAMFGSCLWDKYACAAWSDPGIVFDEKRESINYQEPWYLGWEDGVTRKPGLVRSDSPRTGAYRNLVENGHDLHELHALMAPRPFLVSGGEEDPIERWSVLNHSVEVNRLLGYEGRVAMTNRAAHSPNETSNEQIYRFFDYWLNGVRP